MPNIARDQVVDLQIDPSTMVVRAGMTRGDGQPFGPATWKVSGRLSCTQSNEEVMHCSGNLRGSGMITFAIGGHRESACEISFAVQLHPLVGEDLGGLFHAPLKPGMNDLKHLVLQPASVLCSGRVVDRQGVAVAGQTIDLAVPNMSNGEMFRGDVVPGMLALPAVSGLDGRFELRGWGEEKWFQITDGQQVSLGATEITITADNQKLRKL